MSDYDEEKMLCIICMDYTDDECGCGAAMDAFKQVDCEFCGCEFRWAFVTGAKATAPCEWCVAAYRKFYDAAPAESKKAVKVAAPLTAEQRLTAEATAEANAWITVAAPDPSNRASIAAAAGRCWHCCVLTAETDKTATNLPMCEKCYAAWTSPLVSPGLLEKMSAIVAAKM